MRWSEIWPRWWVYSEADPKRRLTLAQVKRMEAQDLDYLIVMRSAKCGLEITRDDLAGQRFQLYCPPSRLGRPRPVVWAQFDAMEGLKVKHAGDSEKTWLFSVDKLGVVGEAGRFRRRARNASGVGLAAVKKYQFKRVTDPERGAEG